MQQLKQLQLPCNCSTRLAIPCTPFLGKCIWLPDRARMQLQPVKVAQRQHGAASASAPSNSTQPGRARPAQQQSSADSAKISVWQRIKAFFLADRIDRKRLAELGLGAVASYGFVSNATYGTGMAVSWVAFVKQYGVSPLMPGQWKAFMAWYAGFWTIQHFLRPFRFSLALALSPAFDRYITWTQKLTGFNRRNAFGVYLFLLGTASSVLIFGSIFLFAGPLAFSRTPRPA